MNKNVLISIVYLCFSMFIFAEKPNAIKIDTNKSVIYWTGKQLLNWSHSGTMKLSASDLSIDEHKSFRGSFTIDINSMELFKEDMEGKTKEREYLIEHLKSDDFFSANNYPYAYFKIDIASMIDPENTIRGDNNYMIIGRLTIKSITNQISFPAVMKIENENFNASAIITIDRTKWGITYDSGSYIDKISDSIIDDDIQIKVVLSGNIVQ